MRKIFERGALKRVSVLFAAVVIFMVLAMGDQRGCSTYDDPRSFVPVEASMVVVVPPLDQFRIPLADFLDGFDATKGVFDWLHGNYGVDLSSYEGIAASGLDPEAEMLSFYYKEAAFFVALVLDDEEFENLIQVQLRLLGHLDCPQKDMGDLAVRFCPGDVEKDRVAVAWTFHDNAVVIASSENVEGLSELLLEVARRGPDLEHKLSNPVYGQAFERVGGLDGGLQFYAELNENHEIQNTQKDGWLALKDKLVNSAQQGLAFFDGIFLKATTLVIRTDVSAERVSARVHLSVPSVETQWLRANLFKESEGADFGKKLPRDTTLFLRVGLATDKLKGLASAARNLAALVNKDDPMKPVNALLDRVHPLLRGVDVVEHLLTHLTGDIAVAWLGLVQGVPPSKLAQTSKLRTLMNMVDGVLLVETYSAEAFLSAWPITDGACEALGYEVTRAPGISGGPPIIRLSKRRKGRAENLSVFVHENTILVVFGKKAYVDMRAVLEGNATVLHERVETQALKDVVSGAPMAFGVFITLNRISRELADRGSMTYFLRALNTIYEAGAKIQLDESGVMMEIEVLQ